MKKEKKLFSYLGSVFAFCFLALIMFLPDAKAEAALSVKDIDYENSTITIQSDSSDSILYFSDKNKKKWETAMVGFKGTECTMDISWVSATKDYVITFKGDKSNDTANILSVTIPKQVTKFKAKYDLSKGGVTFTGADSADEIEYRKNNTDKWITLGNVSSELNDELKLMLSYMCENGGSIYFRIKGKEGSATDPGKRPSKEAACKITKKTAAPTVTVDTATSKITVKSGWQVRKVDIEEKSGVQYATNFNQVSETYSSSANDGWWHTFNSEQDIDIFDLAPAAEYKDGTSEKDVYLQFRKAATSSSQLSYITTVKVPKQDAPPNAAEEDVEYTSTTTCNLTFSGASTKVPYEYAVIDASDMKGDEIVDIESVTWKTVSSNAATAVTKKEAPDQGTVVFRKKAVGKLGDDNFKLASPYVKVQQPLDYPDSGEEGEIKDGKTELYFVDGVAGSQQIFTIRTQFNTQVASMQLSEIADQTTGEGTAAVSSKTAKDADAEDNKKYIVTTTVKGVTLSNTQKAALEEKGEITLYAYIVLKSNSTEELAITSNAGKGVIIHVLKASTVEEPEDSDPKSETTVNRIIGAVTTDAQSGCQYEDFWFNLKLGKAKGSDIASYVGSSKTMGIESVTFGNYTLIENTDYEYEDEKFTVHLSKFEENSKVVSSYGKTQSLIINLTSGEKLEAATIKLIPPISLNDTYAWAFSKASLVTEEAIVSGSGEDKTTTIKPVNSFSVGYTIDTTEVNGVKVKQVSYKDITLNDVSILTTTGPNTITFSNAVLKTMDPIVSQPVKFEFEVNYNNGHKVDYTINQGCYFTIR